MMKQTTILFLMLFTALTLSAQQWGEINKTYPMPYLENIKDEMGQSVAIDGDYAVVGIPQGTIGKGGFAYVYHYNGSHWEVQAKLTASDGESSDHFGNSVAISGDNIVVGAYNNDNGGVHNGAAYIFTKSPGGWIDTTETAKLTTTDAASSDYFGYSVSISDTIIVVGAYGDDDNGSSSGSAYVFVKPSGGWSDMTETAKLTASDGATSDSFGKTVSVSDNVVVIGAYNNDENGSNSGKAYVFVGPATGWSTMTETAKLTASDAASSDNLGLSVSISGDNIVVGAYGDDDNGSLSGSAYVFVKPSGGWSDMTETAKLTASDGESKNYLGYSVGISGDNVVVGAMRYNGFTGKSYEFTKPSGGWSNMTETAILTASDADSSAYFGNAVAICGEHIFTGAYRNAENGYNSGAVYAYLKPGGDWSNATETQKIIDIQHYANIGDKYGSSVFIDGEYAVVGAPYDSAATGKAYVLHYDGTDWITIAQLTASDGEISDYFGKSVSISEDNIVVGAYGYDDVNYSIGAVYVFTKPSGGWRNATETAKLTASDGSSNDNFGYSVSISGNTIIVGTPKDDGSKTNSGSAYIFEKPSGGWTDATETAKLTASDEGTSDYFGYSVDISENTAVVGAYHEDNANGNQSGSVYVFVKPAGGWSNMNETAKLTASDGDNDDNFGYSVSISGDDIAVGVPYDDKELGVTSSGSIYMFTKPTAGWVDGTETAQLTASDAATDDCLGYSVSISDSVVVAGAYGYDNDKGTAYIFVKPYGGWGDDNETDKITASDAEEGDYFGCAVGVSDSIIVVGASLNDDSLHGNMSGSAYFYKESIVTRKSLFIPSICNGIKVYPNPAHETLTIVNAEDVVRVEIVDVTGKVVKTINNNALQTIDVRNLKNSIYFLRLQKKNEIEIIKFVKE